MTTENTNTATNDFIYTQYGKFYFDSPEFKPEAIAHSLAQIPRWTGHTDRNVTCAEHACLVAGIMAVYDTGNPLEGLLADAADAYMGHLSKPMRQRFPDYVAAWDKLDRAIRANWSLPLDPSEDYRRANHLAVFLEAYKTLPDHGFDIPLVRTIASETMDPDNLKWRVHGVTREYPWQFWDHLWLKAYHGYTPKIEVVSGDVEMQAARAQDGKVIEGSSLVIP